MKKKRKKSKQTYGDIVFKKVLEFCSLSLVIIFILLCLSLIINSSPSLKAFGWKFLYTSKWNVATGEFGGFAAIFGTILTSFLAIIIAAPLAFFVAIFINEIMHDRLRFIMARLVEVLAMIPSIVYGMWGIFVFVPIMSKYIEPFLITVFGSVPLIKFLFRGSPIGLDYLTTALILVFMILPIISSVMREVISTIPEDLKEAGYAMGITRYEIVTKIYLPYARSGFLGSIVLGLGRALGETMAVAFVIGNSSILKYSLLAQGSSISSTIANEFGEAFNPLHVSSLMELGLILFVLSFITVVISRLIKTYTSRGMGRRII